MQIIPKGSPTPHAKAPSRELASCFDVCIRSFESFWWWHRWIRWLAIALPLGRQPGSPTSPEIHDVSWTVCEMAGPEHSDGPCFPPVLYVPVVSFLCVSGVPSALSLPLHLLPVSLTAVFTEDQSSRCPWVCRSTVSQTGAPRQRTVVPLYLNLKAQLQIASRPVQMVLFRLCCLPAFMVGTKFSKKASSSCGYTTSTLVSESSEVDQVIASAEVKL